MEYDLAPNGPTRTPPRPVTAQRTSTDRPAPLLDLQRLAGNAAVSSAVKSGRFDSSLPVQRLEDDQEAVDEEFEEENAESEEVNAEEAEAEGEQEEIQEESEG